MLQPQHPNTLWITNIKKRKRKKTYLTLDLGGESEGWAAPEMCCHSVGFSFLFFSFWLFTVELGESFKNGEAG